MQQNNLIIDNSVGKFREPLRFRKDGTFTIVQFTDIHWKNGEGPDQLTGRLMDSVLDIEKPDLVVYTGDTIDSGGCKDPCRSFREAVSAADNRSIPWAAVFGNHDAEHGVSKEQLMRVQAECRHCLSESGPEEISGVGNFTLTIHGEEDSALAALYFLDSGAYAGCGLKGYDWIRRDQIDWLVNQSAKLNEKNGQRLPSLLFFHIPLPEYKQVWEQNVCSGHRYEEVCCAPLNSGMFAALVEMGGVMGTFVGHDHINDYCGALHGIRLCYGRATGYNTYGREGFRRGTRIIRLNEGCDTFDTWLRLDDGSRLVQKEHRPDTLDSLKIQEEISQ